VLHGDVTSRNTLLRRITSSSGDGDEHGNVVILASANVLSSAVIRNCWKNSVADVNAELRREMHRVAVDACKKFGYLARNDRILVDDDQNFYFMK